MMEINFGKQFMEWECDDSGRRTSITLDHWIDRIDILA